MEIASAIYNNIRVPDIVVIVGIGKVRVSDLNCSNFEFHYIVLWLMAFNLNWINMKYALDVQCSSNNEHLHCTTANCYFNISHFERDDKKIWKFLNH